MRRGFGTWAALICALVLTLARPIPSPAQAMFYYRDVIPDAVVVQRQCTRLHTAFVSVGMQADDEQLQRTCGTYARNHDGDAWMTAYEPLRQRLLARCASQPCDPNLVAGLGSLDEHWKTQRSNPVPSYSMLLFPDATRMSAESWNATKTAFLNFGAATGPDHWAIWLADDQTTANLTEAHERSDAFARKFGLDPGFGPFVVVTAARPDRWIPGMRVIVLRIGGGDANSTAAILTSLRDAIVRDPALHGFDSTKRNLQFTDVAQHLAAFARQHSDIIKVVKSYFV
jgi:hypothetical protein